MRLLNRELPFFRKRDRAVRPAFERTPHAELLLETLEPRLLLAADLPVQAAAPVAALDVTVAIDAQAKAIVVLDNTHGGIEIERHQINDPKPIMLAGTDGNDTYRIALDPNLLALNRIVFAGGKGEDTIIGPSVGSSWSLDRVGKGHVGSIAFWQVEHLVGSQSAQDTLSGPAAGTLWTIDGEGKGNLLGISFSGFEQLNGGSQGPDTFKIHPLGGSTVGDALNHGVISIDGGLGSTNDRIIIEGNHFLDAHVMRTGSGVGTIEIDGMKISHTGVKNVQLNALDGAQAVLQNWTFTGQSDDALTVGDDPSDATQVSVSGSDPLDTTTFAKPTGGLTILAPGTQSAVTLNSLTLHGTDLTVTSGTPGVNVLPLTYDYTNAITVSANSEIDTSMNGGQGGDITLQAITIDVDSGAVLNASGTTGGAVKLSVDYRREATGFILDQITNAVTSRNATISIDSGAVIDAGSIDIVAKAGDQSLDNTMGDYGDGAPEGVLKVLEDIQSFAGIPVSVLVKRSAAAINITGSSLIATSGDVTIDASAESDGIGTGTFFRAPDGSPGGLAFVYVQTDASATIDLDYNTIVSQNGDVNITTEGTTNASGTARVSQNFARQGSPTNPQNVQAAAAVGNVTLVSTITLDDTQGASIIESFHGNVNIAATGNNSNEPGAETESYKDGLAGFTLGLALSDATVEVTVASDVTIKGGRPSTVDDYQQGFNPFTAIDPVADTIAVASTAGYKTGDAVTYSAESGGAASGLVDAQTYYVIVVDATHFQLATTRADARAGTAIQLGVLPALEDLSGQRAAFSQVQESAGQIIFDYDPGFTVGEKVYYNAAAGQHIAGLNNKNTSDPSTVYTVASITQSTGGSQWLVALTDANNNAVSLNLDPTLTDASGNAYGFSLNGSALVLKSAQPGFATGQAFTYTEALGFDIPTLTDGTTYYLVKDPTDDTNTVFRLAASASDASGSDGYSQTVALGHVDTDATSGDQHILQALNTGGVSITANLTTTEEAITKSGQGGEPETSDAASKGELLPVLGNILSNVNQLATLPNDQSGNMVNPMDQRIANNVPQGSGSNSNFGVAATVAFVKSSNTAKVEIAGTVKSNADLTAAATIIHTIQTQAEGVKSPTQAGETTFTIAGAAAVGLSFDNAQVLVDADAVLDASNTINMNASVSYPFIAPLSSPGDFFGYVLNQLASNPLSTISGFLGNVFLLKQDLVNSWARAVDNDTNADISIAGAVDFQSRNAFATVDIMGGAQVNQDTNYRADTQTIDLQAATSLQMINVGGIFDYDLSPEGIIKSFRAGPSNSIQPYGAQGGKVGFGGAYRQLELDTTTHAIIHGADNSGIATAIYTAPSGSLTVGADNQVFALGVTQSGTSSGQFGVSGSAAYNHQVTNTVAAIEAGAIVNAGGVGISADDNSVVPTYSGDVVKGKNLGLGVSFVYNDIDRTTQAYIGAVGGTSPSSADMTVANLSVDAQSSGQYFGFALASATADTNPTPAGGTNASAPPNPSNPANNQPVNPSQAQSTGNYGLAVSGDIVFNQVNDTTQAVVNENATINSTRSVFITAGDYTELLALTGTAAIAEGSNASAGLAGSYSENRLITTTVAELYSDSGLFGLNLGSGADLQISATQQGFATAVAAGGSGGINHADGSAEIAGSVAINNVTPTTTARLVGSTVNSTGQIDITATDTIPIYALAGAFSFGGKQGYGAAVATNITEWTSPTDNTHYVESVAAQIQNSYISQTSEGSITVSASMTDPSNVDRIVAVAGSLGQGSSVGVSGTVAVNDLGSLTSNAVEASISGSNIYGSTDAGSVVSLTATLDQTVLAIGGEVALATGKSSTFALGAGVAYNETNLPVEAFISFSNVTARALLLTATISGDTTATSAGAAIASNGTGVAGSAAVNVIGDQVTASIDGLSSTQLIDAVGFSTLSASYSTNFKAGAGELALGTNSGGAAVAVNEINTGTRAYIGAASMQTGRVLSVLANTSGQVTTVAVGADGGENFAFGASVAVTATDTTTQTWIGGTSARPASISTPASVKIAAESAMTFITVGGTLAASVGPDPGAGASVGVANATLLRNDKTQAWASTGSISFGGTGQSMDTSTAVAGALQDVPDYIGLSITAISTDDVTTASAGATVNGLEDFGGAGSVSVTKLDKSTNASVESAGTTLAGANATNVNVLAYDASDVNSGAGGLAGGAEAGVGAGVDVISITKDTVALFAPQGTVGVGGNLSVQALSKENLLSVALGASLINATAIAGAASTYVLDLTTTASIGSTDAVDITVAGSAILAAQDDTVLNQIPGAVSLGIETGVGGAVGVIDVKAKTVDASVASGVNLTVNASADQSAIEAATGEFEVGFVAPSGQPGDVPPPNVSIDTGKQTGDSNAPSIDNQNLTKVRTAAPVFESTRGLAVSAINTGKFKGLNFAGGGASTAAVDVDAGVNVINMTTTTRIASNVSLISSGDVVLASGADLQKLGVSGSAAISGEGSGAAGADVTIVNMTTRTDIAGGSTSISAGTANDLIVNAQAQEDIFAITAGLAASGGVGLDAGATVIKINNTTFAGISTSAATLSAGGNVLIAAGDDTTTAAISGNVAIGVTAGAFGGSAVVTLIDKNTTANVANGSSIDALANNSNTLTVLDGTVSDGNGQFNTMTAQGVVIEARSSEDVTAVAVGGGAGFYVGAGAGATYTLIDSDTYATVGSGVADVNINQASGASANQAVNINAANDASTFTIGGGLGLGGTGLGGGVDVGRIHNDVDATLGTGSKVNAAGDFNMFALELVHIDSYAASAGAGSIGINGSVSVWNIGTGINSTYSDSNQSADALSFNHGSGSNSSVAASADAQTNRSDITTLLSKYTNNGAANGGQVADLVGGASSDYSAAQPDGDVQSGLTDPTASGVNAEIGNGVTITAGSFNLGGFTTVVTKQTSGGASAGLGAVGASVNILNRGDTTQGFSDATIDSSGAVNVTAGSVSDVTSNAYGGTAGVLVGLGAQVAVVNDNSSAAAIIGGYANVERADGGVYVAAGTNADVTIDVYGIDIAGVLAAGAGVAEANVTGATTATLAAPNVNAGYVDTGSVVVNATSEITTNLSSQASTGGVIVGVVGNVSLLNITPTVTAAIDSGSNAGTINTLGAVLMSASSTVDGNATANGFSEGGVVSVGVSIASSTADSTVSAYIGANNTINTGGLQMSAVASDTITSDGTANAGYSLVGGGVGVRSTADITNHTSAYILGNVTTTGSLDVTAQHIDADAVANANGILGLGLANVGYSISNANVTSTVLAYIDQGTVKTTDGGTIAVFAAEGDPSNSTGPQAMSTASQGVYAGGSELESQAYVTHTPTVLAGIGNPVSQATTTAQVQAQGDLTITAGSWTSAAPQALTGPNQAFQANSEATATATATKVTQVWIAASAQLSSGGAASISAISVEDLSPLAAGYDGDGIYANGEASTEVWLSRLTNVTIDDNATLTAETSIALTAESTTTSEGALTDNQNEGAFNAVFHAGVGDSAQGSATPVTQFNIAFDGKNNFGEAATSVFISGALTAPVITLEATTTYGINVNTFSWVTADAFSTVTADAYGYSQDDAIIQFSDTGSATASQSASLNAGYASNSVFSFFTKLHYSELGGTLHQDTNSTSGLNGNIALIDNDSLNAVTSPNIAASITTNPGVVMHWDYTLGSENDHKSLGSHVMTPGVTVSPRNDWSTRTSSGNAAPFSAASGADSTTERADAGALQSASSSAWNRGADPFAQRNDWMSRESGAVQVFATQPGERDRYRDNDSVRGFERTPLSQWHVDRDTGWILHGDDAPDDDVSDRWIELDHAAKPTIALAATPKIHWTR